jgi:Tol biopolymer transport system component
MVQGWLADGRILFCSFDTGWDVFLADFDPESLTLTSDPALVSLWAGRARLTLWSHEPDRLMYASFHEDAADGDLYVATLSDDPTQPLRGEPERIAVQGAFRYPQWDSARGLVYFSRRLEERGVGLFVVDVDSGQERRLLPDQTLVGTVRLALTDAGRQLLFSSAPQPRPWLPDPTLAPGLYLYDVESEQVRQLLGGETRDHGPFAVSPDGDLLAMTDVDGVEVQLVAIDGAQRRVIATAPGGGWTVGALSFLPDRRTLAYAVTRELPESFCGESELWLVDLSGGEPRRLEGVAAYDLQAGSWSPDGRRFAFSSWKCDSAVKLFEPY